MACDFKKKTFNKCIGAVDTGMPFSNLEKNNMTYAAVCWYSKKYECTDGKKELKLKKLLLERQLLLLRKLLERLFLIFNNDRFRKSIRENK